MSLFKLILINLRVGVLNFFEYLIVLFRYYRSFSFARADFSLLLCYLLRSPFRASRQYWKKRGADDLYVYGETPLTTLDKIVQNCDITSSERFCELGCGRGRTCFWLSQFFGSEKVAGVEIIPEFIDKAKRVSWHYQCQNLDFWCLDMLEFSFSNWDVIYLYGSNFSDSFIQKLARKLESLPEGAKVITVSYSLSDYARKGYFRQVKSFPARFPWGVADVYLQLREHS